MPNNQQRKPQEVIWSYNADTASNSTFYLNQKDVNHLVRIYNKYHVQPESISKVSIHFLCDKEPLIRYLIKELDILLTVGCEFEILATYTTAHGQYLRSIPQLMYEFSVATAGRYVLKEKAINQTQVKLRYRKEKSTNPIDDRIDKWSFGIITNGKKNEQVCALIKSIQDQNISNSEIIVCGPDPLAASKTHCPVKVINDVTLKDDIRAPITAKKNRLFEAMQNNNFCILHDRYLFHAEWFSQMQKYGNYFDLLTMPNLSQAGNRVVDWNEYVGKPSEVDKLGRYCLGYSEWSNNWYAQGGLIIGKQHLFEKKLLDERLHWGELEDIQFSQIANLNGVFLYFDVDNFIWTDPYRLGEIKQLRSKLRKKMIGFLSQKKIMVRQWLDHRRNIQKITGK